MVLRNSHLVHVECLAEIHAPPIHAPPAVSRFRPPAKPHTLDSLSSVATFGDISRPVNTDMHISRIKAAPVSPGTLACLSPVDVSFREGSLSSPHRTYSLKYRASDILKVSAPTASSVAPTVPSKRARRGALDPPVNPLTSPGFVPLAFVTSLFVSHHSSDSESCLDSCMNTSLASSSSGLPHSRVFPSFTPNGGRGL